MRAVLQTFSRQPSPNRQIRSHKKRVPQVV
nr:unnamed protein product [Callosobruchus analis]